jgi:hypothetical protein
MNTMRISISYCIGIGIETWRSRHVAVWAGNDSPSLSHKGIREIIGILWIEVKYDWLGKVVDSPLRKARENHGDFLNCKALLTAKKLRPIEANECPNLQNQRNDRER